MRPKTEDRAPFDQSPELVTAAQLAKLLNVSVRTIWRMRDLAELPAPIALAGRLVRWRLASVRKFLAEREATGGRR